MKILKLIAFLVMPVICNSQVFNSPHVSNGNEYIDIMYLEKVDNELIAAIRVDNQGARAGWIKVSCPGEIGEFVVLDSTGQKIGNLKKVSGVDCGKSITMLSLQHVVYFELRFTLTGELTSMISIKENNATDSNNGWKLENIMLLSGNSNNENFKRPLYNQSYVYFYAPEVPEVIVLNTRIFNGETKLTSIGEGGWYMAIVDKSYETTFRLKCATYFKAKEIEVNTRSKDVSFIKLEYFQTHWNVFEVGISSIPEGVFNDYKARFETLSHNIRPNWPNIGLGYETLKFYVSSSSDENEGVYQYSIGHLTWNHALVKTGDVYATYCFDKEYGNYRAWNFGDLTGVATPLGDGNFKYEEYTLDHLSGQYFTHNYHLKIENGIMTKSNLSNGKELRLVKLFPNESQAITESSQENELISSAEKHGDSKFYPEVAFVVDKFIDDQNKWDNIGIYLNLLDDIIDDSKNDVSSLIDAHADAVKAFMGEISEDGRNFSLSEKRLILAKIYFQNLSISQEGLGNGFYLVSIKFPFDSNIGYLIYNGNSCMYKVEYEYKSGSLSGSMEAAVESNSYRHVHIGNLNMTLSKFASLKEICF